MNTRTKFYNYTMHPAQINISSERSLGKKLPKTEYFDHNLLPLHTVWSSWGCIMALVIYIIARIDNKTVVLLLAKPSHLSEYAN